MGYDVFVIQFLHSGAVYGTNKILVSKVLNGMNWTQNTHKNIKLQNSKMCSLCLIMGEWVGGSVCLRVEYTLRHSLITTSRTITGIHVYNVSKSKQEQTREHTETRENEKKKWLHSSTTMAQFQNPSGFRQVFFSYFVVLVLCWCNLKVLRAEYNLMVMWCLLVSTYSYLLLLHSSPPTPRTAYTWLYWSLSVLRCGKLFAPLRIIMIQRECELPQQQHICPRSTSTLTGNCQINFRINSSHDSLSWSLGNSE